MAPRLKIAAALLLLGGCIRLLLLSFDVIGYGNLRIPIPIQLIGPYLVLVLAVARVRSERVSRWVLGYVSAQVIFTFIVCYELPRTLASTLEKRIPFIALAQIAGAVLVLVGAQWCDRKVLTLQQILFGFLVALTISTLLLLEVFRSKLEDAHDLLVAYGMERAMHEAEADFTAGRYRQYEIKTIVLPTPSTNPVDQRRFTGRTNGPFQVWTLPRWSRDEDESFWLRYDSESAHTYNMRMAFLYQMSQLHPSKQKKTDTP